MHRSETDIQFILTDTCTLQICLTKIVFSSYFLKAHEKLRSSAHTIYLFQLSNTLKQSIKFICQWPSRKFILLVFGTCRMVNEMRRSRSIVQPMKLVKCSQRSIFTKSVPILSCDTSAMECMKFVYRSFITMIRLRGSSKNRQQSSPSLI